jgi:hypothetical protein
MWLLENARDADPLEVIRAAEAEAERMRISDEKDPAYCWTLEDKILRQVRKRGRKPRRGAR